MAVIINGNNTPTAGSVTYGDGSQYANTASGSAGQVLTSAGSSAPVWATPASVNLATGVTGTLPIANGGTNSTATPTAGGVVYGTGTAQAVTTAGTSGQVLRSNGASAPSWVTPSTGALVFISSATASSSATIDFTGISSTYDVYVVEFVSIVGASSTGFKALTSSNNGSSYDTSNYAFSSIGCGSSIFTAQVDSSGGGATYISIWNNNSNSISSTTSDSGLSGFAYIMNPASSANTQILWNATWCSGANAVSFGTGTGVKTSTSPVNAIRFLMNSGNIASGTIRLYGIANS